MVRRSGLGRGLGALIPPAEGTSQRRGGLREIPLASIRPNQFQPRTRFDEEALSALVDSIRAVGLLQPVLVREVAEGEYELIAGERRCRAARRAGLQAVPALVQQADDRASLEQALVENIHREDLNPLDEAGAYQQLIEDFNLTHEEVARRVGKSRVAITNALRLFQLPPSVQRLVRDGALTAGHARALLATPDRDQQEELALRAIEVGMSVRALEAAVRAAVAPDVPAEGELSRGDPAPSDRRGGSDAGSDGRRPPRALPPPGVVDLEELLAERLATRVRVDVTGSRGRIVIEFADLDDLERIYREIVGTTSISS
jgi:ParB family chromosome partitioning protein